jgi:hypothetical protein
MEDDGGKKQEEKKRKKKKKKPQDWFIYVLIGVLALVAYNQFVPPPPPPPSPPPRPSPFRLQTRKNVNTTSVPYAAGMYSAKALSKLLERHLRQSSKYHALCMHHLDVKSPYRGCSMQTTDGHVYFMLNPVIHDLSGELIAANEDSLSCEGPVKSKRHTCANVTWSDGALALNAQICGNIAIALQLVTAEFLGALHC